MATFFADHFGIDPDTIENHGAFNISLVTDLPLFIDPFLLFSSQKVEYHSRVTRQYRPLSAISTSTTAS
jgi:hypothetical protein